MHIEIAERLKPYSFKIGTYFVLPLSGYRIQFFPTCLHVEDLTGETVKRKTSLQFSMDGPFKDFLVQLDLEHSQIVVSGTSLQGFFRYTLKAIDENALKNQEGIILKIEKAPCQIAIVSNGQWEEKEAVNLNAKEQKIFGQKNEMMAYPAVSPIDMERLSLGSHRAQDVEMIERRKDFNQVLPIWHRLGQLTIDVPNKDTASKIPSDQLPKSHLDTVKETLKIGNLEEGYFNLKKLFLTGFDFAFSPRSQDDDHQGILLKSQPVVTGSPLQVLKCGVDLIRSLFIQSEKNIVKILPALPPEFHSGRLLNSKICYGDKNKVYGRIDLEWSKKEIRRVIFRAEQTSEIMFEFCRKKTKCRLRTSSSSHVSTRDKGSQYFSNTKLTIEAGVIYYLDNFQ